MADIHYQVTQYTSIIGFSGRFRIYTEKFTEVMWKSEAVIFWACLKMKGCFNYFYNIYNEWCKTHWNGRDKA